MLADSSTYTFNLLFYILIYALEYNEGFFSANIKGRETTTLDQEQNMQEMDMERPILSLAGKSISSSGRAKVLPEDSPHNRRVSLVHSHFILSCVPECSVKNG